MPECQYSPMFSWQVRWVKMWQRHTYLRDSTPEFAQNGALDVIYYNSNQWLDTIHIQAYIAIKYDKAASSSHQLVDIQSGEKFLDYRILCHVYSRGTRPGRMMWSQTESRIYFFSVVKSSEMDCGYKLNCLSSYTINPYLSFLLQHCLLKLIGSWYI